MPGPDDGPSPAPPRPGERAPAAEPLPKDPGEAPARPTQRAQPRPGDFVFEVERPGGLLQRFPEGEDVAVLVMMGNPKVQASEYVRADGQRVPAVSVKANTLVVWVDLKSVSSLDAFQALGGNADGEKAKTPRPAPKPGAFGGPAASILQEGVLGLYAEGAVELKFGELVFRAEALHLEPRTYQALLIEPSFTGQVQAQDVLSSTAIPVHVRARRGRLVARGLGVFDDAVLATTRSDDRLELRVKRVTVEDWASAETRAAAAEEPNLLGYRSVDTQRYRAQGIVMRGERIPVFYLPDAQFGAGVGEAYPIRIKRVDAGLRGSLGRYAFVGLGANLGPDEDPWGEWLVDLGGYTKRGPAVGFETTWARRFATGKLDTFFLPHDNADDDRNGFVPPDPFRWIVELENRSRLRDDLIFDVEYNQFSDRGVNREFFESDDLEHKDRESYGRLRYAPGNAVATFDARPHVRDFVTETTALPEAGLWLTSFPLIEPAYAGGPALDLTTETHVGRLERRFDEALNATDYGAQRWITDTVAHLAFDVGDLRVTPWAGTSAAAYLDRSDGAPDVMRAALLAGVRADLQAHRVYAACGGPFRLDGLRHIVDLTGLYGGRFFDNYDPSEVPYFDRHEDEQGRSQVTGRMRNRLQTHDGSRLRSVFDLEATASWYPDDVGPYLRKTPGDLDLVLLGEPRPGVYVSGQSRWDFGISGVYTGMFGVGVKASKDLSVFAGVRYVRHEAFGPTLDVGWRWSEKYGVRIVENVDFRNGENSTRVLFRRYSPDHVIQFGIEMRNGEFGLDLNIEPAVAGVTTWPREAFKDQPNLDPWGAFAGLPTR